jgi:hypothetical protein
MSRPTTSVTSILDYLARYERYAELSNRRSEKHHFQECWCLVFSAFFGDFRLAHYQKPAAKEVVFSPPVNVTRPKWFTEHYSHPMRKVVRTIKGFDVLGCGHKIESHYDGTTAKHRRCKECKGLPPANEE